MTSRLSRWVTLLVTFAGIGLPWLFARKVLDANDPVAQSVTFLPAPYAFIIWAPIYTGLLIFAVWQARSAQADNPRVASIRPWLMLSAVLNAAWFGALALRHPGWTVPIVFATLVVALIMHRVGQIGGVACEPGEVWLRLPFSLYAGWLMVATFTTLSVELARIGWDGFGWSPVTIFCTSAESAAVSGCPSCRSNTKMAPTPLCSGKASLWRLAARIDSYLPGRNSDWSLVALSLGAVAMITTDTTIQPRMTNHGCRVASRPSPVNTQRGYPKG